MGRNAERPISTPLKHLARSASICHEQRRSQSTVPHRKTKKGRSPERLLLVASVAARPAWPEPGCISPARGRRGRRRTRCSAAWSRASPPRPTAATRHRSSALLPAPDAPSSASSTFLSPPSSYGFFSGSILAKSEKKSKKKCLVFRTLVCYIALMSQCKGDERAPVAKVHRQARAAWAHRTT